MKLSRIEVELNLKKHCIETAIKRSRNRILSEYFRSKGDNTELEEKLNLLQEALSQFDFSALRTMYKELAGNSDSKVVLNGVGSGPPRIVMDGHVVDTLCCAKK